MNNWNPFLAHSFSTVEEGAYLCGAPCREGPDNHRSCPMVKRILNAHKSVKCPEAPRLHGSETQQPHRSATDKRPRGSPTWETPLQTCERRPAVGSSRSGF